MKQETEADTRERFAGLWCEAESAVRAFAFSSVSGFQDAEDVVQQVALTVARRFHEYDASRPFVSWALWLAKSQVIDHYRRRAREKRHLSEAVLDQIADVLAQSQSERPARQAALETCYEKLPEKSRTILELRYLERNSVDHVAEAIHSTNAAVRVMLFRIRKKLADCIQMRLAQEAAAYERR